MRRVASLSNVEKSLSREKTKAIIGECATFLNGKGEGSV